VIDVIWQSSIPPDLANLHIDSVGLAELRVPPAAESGTVRTLNAAERRTLEALCDSIDGSEPVYAPQRPIPNGSATRIAVSRGGRTTRVTIVGGAAVPPSLVRLMEFITRIRSSLTRSNR
jgi:hypothetical protein